MTRLYGMVVLALLAYGRAVGCERGNHREVELHITAGADDGERVLWYAYHCPCGRIPYMECYRRSYQGRRRGAPPP